MLSSGDLSERPHLFPFRTEKLSSYEAMILHTGKSSLSPEPSIRRIKEYNTTPAEVYFSGFCICGYDLIFYNICCIILQTIKNQMKKHYFFVSVKVYPQESLLTSVFEIEQSEEVSDHDFFLNIEEFLKDPISKFLEKEREKKAFKMNSCQILNISKLN